METALDGETGSSAVEKQHKPAQAVKEESDALGIATQEKVKLTVVQFTEEDPVLKWFLRVMSVMLIVCLVFLWVFYR